LAEEIGSYLNIYNMQISAGATLVVELLRAGLDMSARQRAFDKFEPVTSSEFYTSKKAAADRVKFAARELLMEIMAVE
jgi:hypothetical protein